MVKWLVIALAISPIWFGLGWAIWETYVLPRRIPQTEIERLADELARGNDAERIALINEDRARRYCDGREEGKWRRVHRTLLRRRLRAAKSEPK